LIKHGCLRGPGSPFNPPGLVPGKAKLVFAQIRRPSPVVIVPTEAVHAGSVENRRAPEGRRGERKREGGNKQKRERAGGSPAMMKNCGPTIFSSLVCALMSR